MINILIYQAIVVSTIRYASFENESIRVYRIVNCHLSDIIYNSIGGTDNVIVLKPKQTGRSTDNAYSGSE